MPHVQRSNRKEMIRTLLMLHKNYIYFVSILLDLRQATKLRHYNAFIYFFGCANYSALIREYSWGGEGGVHLIRVRTKEGKEIFELCQSEHTSGTILLAGSH